MRLRALTAAARTVRDGSSSRSRRGSVPLDDRNSPRTSAAVTRTSGASARSISVRCSNSRGRPYSICASACPTTKDTSGSFRLSRASSGATASSPSLPSAFAACSRPCVVASTRWAVIGSTTAAPSLTTASLATSHARGHSLQKRLMSGRTASVPRPARASGPILVSASLAPCRAHTPPRSSSSITRSNAIGPSSAKPAAAADLTASASSANTSRRGTTAPWSCVRPSARAAEARTCASLEWRASVRGGTAADPSDAASSYLPMPIAQSARSSALSGTHPCCVRPAAAAARTPWHGSSSRAVTSASTARGVLYRASSSAAFFRVSASSDVNRHSANHTILSDLPTHPIGGTPYLFRLGCGLAPGFLRAQYTRQPPLKARQKAITSRCPPNCELNQASSVLAARSWPLNSVLRLGEVREQPHRQVRQRH